jgi:hypothetical protein
MAESPMRPSLGKWRNTAVKGAALDPSGNIGSIAELLTAGPSSDAEILSRVLLLLKKSPNPVTVGELAKKLEAIEPDRLTDVLFRAATNKTLSLNKSESGITVSVPYL